MTDQPTTEPTEQTADADNLTGYGPAGHLAADLINAGVVFGLFLAATRLDPDDPTRPPVIQEAGDLLASTLVNARNADAPGALTPAGVAWFYTQVWSDLVLAAQAGDDEVCTNPDHDHPPGVVRRPAAVEIGLFGDGGEYLGTLDDITDRDTVNYRVNAFAARAAAARAAGDTASFTALCQGYFGDQNTLPGMVSDLLHVAAAMASTFRMVIDLDGPPRAPERPDPGPVPDEVPADWTGHTPPAADDAGDPR